jgi:hypothetical protein
MININFILQASDFSISALVKWILSACLNIHTLRLQSTDDEEGLNSFLNEIGFLEKLRELKVNVSSSSALKKVTIIASRTMTTLLTFS